MNSALKDMEKKAHILSRRLSKLKMNAQTLERLHTHVKNEQEYYQEKYDDLIEKIYEMKWEKVGT